MQSQIGVMLVARGGLTRLPRPWQPWGCQSFRRQVPREAPSYGQWALGALAGNSAQRIWRRRHASSWRSIGSDRSVSLNAGKQKREASLQVKQQHRCFEGTLFECSYRSKALGDLDSSFSVYVPDAPCIQRSLPYPEDCEEFPVLLYLSEMGCSDREVAKQSSALEHSAACGVIFLSAYTSPRGPNVPDDLQPDMGIGASYYVNATEQPWAKNYRMQDYLKELLKIVHKNFPTCGPDEVSLMGHSMGGMGALALAIRLPDHFRSVSVLAPIAHPTAVPHDASPDVRRALSAYLGDESEWQKFDPTCLIQGLSVKEAEQLPPLFVDVGSETLRAPSRDVYRPLDFVNACCERGIPIELRVRAGFDQSYFFVTSVMEEHLDFHAKHLDAA